MNLYDINMIGRPTIEDMLKVNEDDRYICKALQTDPDTRDMAPDSFPMRWTGVPLGLAEWMAHNRRVAS